MTEASVDSHETVLAQLVNQLARLDPVCSVVVEGSVGRGEHRPDSDIDLLVITWRYREMAQELTWDLGNSVFCSEVDIEARLDQGTLDGLPIDLHCRTPRNHIRLIMHAPVPRWSAARILYDPSGIAAWGEACMRRFYADNPDIAESCRRFHDEHQRWKLDKTVQREHESIMDFVNSLDLSQARIAYHEPYLGWIRENGKEATCDH